MTGVYTGRADVDYSWYGIHKINAYLKINILYSGKRDELLIHISDQNSQQTLCSLFSQLKYTNFSETYTTSAAQTQFSVSTQTSIGISVGSEDHSGAIQDAVLVTSVKFSPSYLTGMTSTVRDALQETDHPERTLGALEAPFFISIGERMNDYEEISSLKKVGTQPEKSFEVFRKECLSGRTISIRT